MVITVAIQSIIVITSLEIAGIHWKANRLRYFSIFATLILALVASISFSYFKFYEISERDNLHVDRLKQTQQQVKDYLAKVQVIRTRILDERRAELEKASEDVSLAYFGTHPQIQAKYKNQVGEGPFWKHYNQLYQEKKQRFDKLEKQFSTMDNLTRNLHSNINNLNIDADDIEQVYQQVLSNAQEIQIKFNQLASNAGQEAPEAPRLMPYMQYVKGVTPSFSMWKSFSLLSFFLAVLVDICTVVLSYRLEFSAPGPLSEKEQELIFECLRQFTEFRINENDELEMVIEKTEIERARRYSDWSRMFAVGFLLSRGFLRKMDNRTVEFAPNLYPLIAERMGDKLRVIKAKANAEVSSRSLKHEVNYEE